MEKLFNKVQELIKSIREYRELEKKAPEGVDPDKHERCVMDVKEKGHDVGSAHAICSSSMKKGEVFKVDDNGQWSIEAQKTDEE